MNTRDRSLLFLAGAGLGGILGAYLVLRKNREKVESAARTTREVADRAEQVAVALENLSAALGVPERAGREDAGQ